MAINEIDWTREPQSEIEAEVRKVWLERRLTGDLLKAMEIKLAAMEARFALQGTHGQGFELPMDLSAAAETAASLFSESRQRRAAAELCEIEAEIKARS